MSAASRGRFLVGTSAALVVGTTTSASAQASARVMVFAGAGLAQAFNALEPAFLTKTGIAATFNFAGSDTLATQIKQGAPADVFASANSEQMNVVASAGLLAAAPQTFARNRLVLIVRKGDDTRVTSPLDLAKPGLRVVLAAPTVPVGDYARRTFAKLAGTGPYPVGFAALVEKNVVSNELTVTAVATKVALGEADAGVVYATDVAPATAASVSLVTFPANVVPDIAFPIAALRDAANPIGARAFVDFILSADGQRFLRTRGFLAP